MLGWGLGVARGTVVVGEGLRAAGRPQGARDRRVKPGQGDSASLLSGCQQARSPGSRAPLRGEGRGPSCKHPWEGTVVLPGRPRLRTAAKIAETGFAGPAWVGRGATRTHRDSGRRRLLPGTPVRPRPPPGPAPAFSDQRGPLSLPSDLLLPL